MSETAQVVIVGAGAVGASIAYHLALRGCRDVIILEKEAQEVTGSTARSLAGFRHQFSNATNIALSRYSIQRLNHFHQEVGGHAGLRHVGYLFLVNDAATWQQFQRNVALQRSMEVRVELLTPDEAARFVPEMVTDDLLGATFGPDDGYCDPHGIAMGYLNRAREMGVRLLREAEALSFAVEGGRVRGVQTSQGHIACETLVNAAGAWSGQVAARAGIVVPVEPSRRNVYVTQPFAEIPDAIPLTIDMGSGFYMRKEGPSLLMGLSNKAEPPGFNTTVDWGWLETVLDAGLARFPILERAGLAEQQCWAGLYEVTPDHNPILGRNPDLEGWVDACGFSGHGIQHAPATGLLIAEEILDGRAHTIAIDDLRIGRFRGAAAAVEHNIV